jgi:ubiquinone/menaquinone biosynthesis C-methylase UbiE
MKNHVIIRATPLYNFIRYCLQSPLEKKVLDCGAGGRIPPLVLFQQHGFQTVGIDISNKQIDLARKFCIENNLKDLGIIKGDIRKLPFENNSISFIYSYNTIFHLSKKEISNSIQEIKRVLRPEGLFYVNLMSPDDKLYGQGKAVGKGEFRQKEGTSEVLHVFHEEEEVDELFKGFKILYTEKRTITKEEWGDYQAAYLDYIIQKK